MSEESTSMGQQDSSKDTVGFLVEGSGFERLVARSRMLETISSTSSQARFSLYSSLVEAGTWKLEAKVGLRRRDITLIL